MRSARPCRLGAPRRRRRSPEFFQMPLQGGDQHNGPNGEDGQHNDQFHQRKALRILFFLYLPAYFLQLVHDFPHPLNRLSCKHLIFCQTSQNHIRCIITWIYSMYNHYFTIKPNFHHILHYFTKVRLFVFRMRTNKMAALFNSRAALHAA